MVFVIFDVTRVVLTINYFFYLRCLRYYVQCYDNYRYNTCFFYKKKRVHAFKVGTYIH